MAPLRPPSAGGPRYRARAPDGGGATPHWHVEIDLAVDHARAASLVHDLSFLHPTLRFSGAPAGPHCIILVIHADSPERAEQYVRDRLTLLGVGGAQIRVMGP